MSSSVTIQVVPHMQQFFRNNDLDRKRFLPVDTIQIDEDRMHPLRSDEAIRTTVG